MATVQSAQSGGFGAVQGGSFLRRVLATTGQVLASIGKSLTLYRDLDRRLAQIEFLNAKSDAELAELGIERDRIQHYVYRDFLAN